jgi:hypothetical protein
LKPYGLKLSAKLSWILGRGQKNARLGYGSRRVPLSRGWISDPL